MKQKRILVKGMGVYHVFNRTAYARYILNDEERDVFVKMLRKQADFCGVEILSYCVMSNHFHLMVRVPKETKLNDAELLRRYKILYHDDPPPKAAMRPSDLASVLAEDREHAEQVRAQLHRRMHHLSLFMKELQQRFGIWYNKTHGNKGALWSERFRSVFIEHNPNIMRIVAAYIELNPVRAAMVDRPDAFRWCSLYAALHGDAISQRGIGIITGHPGNFKCALSLYLRDINGRSDNPEQPSATEQVPKGSEPKQTTNVPSLLQRISVFSRGAILGTSAFVKAFWARYSQKAGLRFRKTQSEGHIALTYGDTIVYALRNRKRSDGVKSADRAGQS